MRRSVQIVMALALLGAGGAAWWGFKASAEDPNAAKRQAMPAPVEIAAAYVGEVSEDLLVIGSTEAPQSVIVRPEIAGVIAEIGFVEGARVQAGQVLFKIEDSIARAEVASADSDVALAQANYARATQLNRTGAGTARALDEAQAAQRTGRARLDLARAQLEKYTIRAPFSGQIGLKKVSVGAYVTGGQDLVQLESVDPIDVSFEVPEVRQREVALGHQVTLEFPAVPGRSFQGTVRAVDATFNQGSRSIRIKASVPNPEGVLRPGLFARVLLRLGVRSAVLVPETALIAQGDTTIVYRLDGAKAVRTPVKLGLRTRQGVEILGGLAEGAVILVSGQQRVSDGGEVAVAAPRAATPSAPGLPTQTGAAGTPATAG